MCLDELNGCELVTLASIISIVIADGLSLEEVGLLGNFFSSIGQNLSTIAAGKVN